MKVLVLDENLNQISVITNFVGLAFQRNYNRIGQFSIQVNLNQKNADTLELGRIIYLDPLRCGIINKVEIRHTIDKSQEILIASGLELKDIVTRRSTIAPSGLVNDEYIDITPEYIIRSLLDKHIINPTDPNRKIDIFKLGQASGIGQAINYQTVSENLSYCIYYELLDLDDLGFKCEVDLASKTAEINTYQGLDRSISQSINPHAIFSINLGTSVNSTVIKDASNMINFIYAGDGQVGLSKTIIPVHGEAQEPVGVNRFEKTGIYSNALIADDLETCGLADIKYFGKVLNVSGATAVGEIEYDLGDKITYIDNRTNEKTDLRIVRIDYSYSGSNPVSTVLTFGKESISMSQALSAKYGQIVKEFVK